MSKRRKQKNNEQTFSRKLLLLIISAFIIAGLLGARVWLKSNSRVPRVAYHPRPKGTLTFNKDIAPIVFQNCSGCHRPTQSGSFTLLTYADAKEHGKQIAEVTRKRIMPPWKPEPGYVEYR